MRLIWARTKAEYFCAEGLTRFLIIRNDLPVVSIVADPVRNLRLRGKARRVGKAQACPPIHAVLMMVGTLSLCPPYATLRATA